jgi:hypothetical protein
LGLTKISGKPLDPLPTDTSATIKLNFNSGLDGIGINLNFPTKDGLPNYLDIAFDKIKITNNISDTN